MVFNGSTRGFHPLGAGSNPATRSKVFCSSSRFRTLPSQGKNRGSNPLRNTKIFASSSIQNSGSVMLDDF